MEHILLLEDETELAAPLGEILRPEGSHIPITYDGETAQTYRQMQRPYHLLILD
ncbi:hypothetical protein [uncultured Thermosynechococcus sp.]|uniref:hypothetical protein n=1 Tax=uncultured Thermosynechococcus sp. TaxID=436945 RepID=UPI00262E0B1F|nr:hypothetical protein [uncultured Thermosynechococcus sp.]